MFPSYINPQMDSHSSTQSSPCLSDLLSYHSPCHSLYFSHTCLPRTPTFVPALGYEMFLNQFLKGWPCHSCFSLRGTIRKGPPCPLNLVTHPGHFLTGPWFVFTKAVLLCHVLFACLLLPLRPHVPASEVSSMRQGTF